MMKMDYSMMIIRSSVIDSLDSFELVPRTIFLFASPASHQEKKARAVPVLV
jgi:hypothetical protein